MLFSPFAGRHLFSFNIELEIGTFMDKKSIEH